MTKAPEIAVIAVLAAAAAFAGEARVSSAAQLAEALGGLLLSESEAIDIFLVSSCAIDWIQIGALNVLDESALKNFLRDRNGAFHYVDVFGIYRAPAGRVLAKQLSVIPTTFREAFAVAYEQALPYAGEIEVSLPFYYLLYLVNRIHAKSQKTGFLRQRRGNIQRVIISY